VGVAWGGGPPAAAAALVTNDDVLDSGFARARFASPGHGFIEMMWLRLLRCAASAWQRRPGQR